MTRAQIRARIDQIDGAVRRLRALRPSQTPKAKAQTERTLRALEAEAAELCRRLENRAAAQVQAFGRDAIKEAS
ncbi:MAG: hypothetical protein AAFU61_08140 [Pseudomonadota bacterium]